MSWSLKKCNSSMSSFLISVGSLQPPSPPSAPTPQHTCGQPALRYLCKFYLKKPKVNPVTRSLFRVAAYRLNQQIALPGVGSRAPARCCRSPRSRLGPLPPATLRAQPWPAPSPASRHTGVFRRELWGCSAIHLSPRLPCTPASF